jgi:PAS domain S-box-containing protein
MFDSNVNPTMTLNELERLHTLVEEVKVALQNQQKILQMRAMSLPPGATQNLENIDKELKTLENLLANDETELRQLRALAATSAIINSSLDLDVVLAKAMKEVITLSGAERGYIVLRDMETGALDFRVAHDPEISDGQRNPTFKGSNTILNEVLTTGEPLLTDNAYKDPRMEGNVSIAQMVLRSVLCVPLSYKGNITGAVYVDNRLRSGVFSEREKDVLAAFANQAAVAIENARLFSRVQDNLAEITEIKEVTANVFASIGSGVITTDENNVVILCNQAAADIFERQIENAIGHPLKEVLPKMNVAVADLMRQVRQSNESQVVEAEMDTNKRGRVILSLKLSPLLDNNGHTEGVAIVVDDVTEQKANDERFKIIEAYIPKGMAKKIADLSQLPLGGERREMTCLFVDVRSLYTLPTDLRPRQVMDILNEYFTVAAEAIQMVDGVIDKYMGTEVMGLFNTQINPQDDHALKAIEAALLMRDEFVDFYRRNGLDPNPHFYRVGIHTGEATAGNVGSRSRRDFTALGDTINLAHRLLENSSPGQIVLSQECCDFIQQLPGGWPSAIIRRDPREITVKNRVTPVVLYEVFRS